MAVLGNLGLFLDVTSPRTIILDRKARLPPLPSDFVLNLFKKDPVTPNTSNNLYAAISSKGIEFDKDTRPFRGKKANSKFNEVDYESSGDEENGNGLEGDEVEDERKKMIEWENAMRVRMKEMEDQRELERKAEELQRRGGGDEDEGGGGDGEGERIEETEEQKKERVRRELEKVAREQAERRKMAQLMFDLGQKAYEKGTYGRSVEFLEAALTIIPRPTMFGGEIQIWLAMAYEANNRHSDCIDLYKQLENTHPIISIRRQARELRYILEAPKLKISQEEMVTIPLIGSSYDNYAVTWSDKEKDRERRNSSTANRPWGRDYLADLLVWRPPAGFEKSQAFWAALIIWLGVVGAALFLQ